MAVQTYRRMFLAEWGGTRCYSRMPGVFISYRHVEPDEQFAQELAQFLKSKGIPVFIDTEIPWGNEWAKAIEEALATADVFVPLISAASVESEMVREEIRKAHQRRKSGRLSIYPSEGDLPYDLASYLHGLQDKRWKSDQKFRPICEALVEALGVKAAKAGQRRPRRRRRKPVVEPVPRPDTGTVPLKSPFYVRRREDDEAEALLESSEAQTIIVRGPRQSGKSSLVVRAREFAQDRGYAVCFIDFQERFQDELLGDVNTFARALGVELQEAFDTEISLEDVEKKHRGALTNLSRFVEQAILRNADSQVVFCFDEVDRVFGCRFRSSFFGMLRGWHQNRANGMPYWEKLNIVLSLSTEPELWIPNPDQSPFNVGHTQYLLDFAPELIRRLNGLHGAPLATLGEINALLELTGGQPYLVRCALYRVAAGAGSVQELREAPFNNRNPFDNHLRGLWRIAQAEKLSAPLRQILRHGNVELQKDFEALRSAGIIRGEERGSVKMFCDLYDRYFRTKL